MLTDFDWKQLIDIDKTLFGRESLLPRKAIDLFIISVLYWIRRSLQYLDSSSFLGIQCDRCNENLYWWIQLDKYLYLNMGCYYKDSVKRKS